MRVLSLDQSSNKTGCALLKDGEVLAVRLIHSAGKEFNEKARNMVDVIEEHIREDKPDVVVMEDTQQQANAGTYKKLCILLGMIQRVCIQYGVPYEVYTPSHWRKILGFDTYKKKRSELKQMAIDYVKDVLGIDVSEDEAEGICIGLAYGKEHDLW